MSNIFGQDVQMRCHLCWTIDIIYINLSCYKNRDIFLFSIFFGTLFIPIIAETHLLLRNVYSESKRFASRAYLFVEAFRWNRHSAFEVRTENVWTRYRSLCETRTEIYSVLDLSQSGMTEDYEIRRNIMFPTYW